MTVNLSRRAKARFGIAARLLESQKRFDPKVPRDQFYVAIAACIEAMPAVEREELRQLTDWVEDYQRAEAVPKA